MITKKYFDILSSNMKSPLSIEDHRKLLRHYGVRVPKSKSRLRSVTRKLLAAKLCKCIKKVKASMKSETEQPSIAICRRSIFQRKNLEFSRFTCRKRQSLNPENSLHKTGKIQLNVKKARTRKRVKNRH
jgi:hypothetical protein